MAASFLRMLFYVANIVQFLYVIYFRWDLKLPGLRYQPFGEDHPFASKFLPFLTYWNVLLQILYFSVCLCNEVFGSEVQPKDKESPSALQKIRDFLFSTLAFPVGIFVTISFWLIYGVDRNLIWPMFFDKFYPLFVNHMLHTTCTISQLIEMVTVYHAYPSTTKGVMTTIGFYLTYVAWILFLAFNNNVWIYPVLQILSPVGRTFFIAAFGVLGGTLFLFGRFINQRVWHTKVNEKTSAKTN